MVKIRLQRVGAKKAPFYHVVIADSRSPRDGKIIEQIGTYNPMTKPSEIKIDLEKVDTWIKNGAKPTDSVKSLIERAEKGSAKNVKESTKTVQESVEEKVVVKEAAQKKTATEDADDEEPTIND